LPKEFPFPPSAQGAVALMQPVNNRPPALVLNLLVEGRQHFVLGHGRNGFIEFFPVHA
jgi:hypothetical protein